MNPSNPQHLLQQAQDLYRVGRLDQAAEAYRRILGQYPDLPAALAELGFVLLQRADHAAAGDLLRRAIALDANVAIWHAGYAMALSMTGDRTGAIAHYRQSLAMDPNLPDAQFNLGIELQAAGQTAVAIAAYQAAIRLRPNYVEAMNNLGNALYEIGQVDDAMAVYRQALALRPDHASAYQGLGNALLSKGELTQAVAAYERGVALAPNLAEAHFNLANALQQAGQPDRAMAAYQRSLALRPDYPSALNNLGSLHQEQAELDSAIHFYRTAAPKLLAAHNNLIYILHFHPNYGMADIAGEQRRWREIHAAPFVAMRHPHENRSPDRRLRVGYVSAHFRNHPVGRFMLPLLANHNRQRFEIVCYSDVEQEDDKTRRLRSHADLWRSTRKLSDAQLAQQIRADRVDVLVDLTLHMHGCRLLTFAAEPAPVQVTYLAYCSTSGLDSMHYRLTDPILDPPHEPTPFYSERSVHLPQSYWCYPPPDEAPALGALPAIASGFITFGCLNNFYKVTPPLWSAWYEILHSVPRSRLMISCPPGSHHQRIIERFAAAGLDPSRLELIGRTPPADYFKRYLQIDIALDSFPHGGGTTTCDALWMGVPVITWACDRAVSRGGKSILTNLNLAEMIAASAADYVRIAQTLAGDLLRLLELRRTLRERMLASPLMDGASFTAGVEQAFGHMSS